MDGVNKTLYIPLYGKAYVSRKGILLNDPKAEQIWAQKGVPLKGKAKSKWLAYYMGMRSAVFDRWLTEKLEEIPNAVIVHVGCGLDSRVQRIETGGNMWFDLDFPEVIAERKGWFQETDTYHMIASDVRDPAWVAKIPENLPAIVLMEGVSMYLTREELNAVLSVMGKHFDRMLVLMDCYTEFAAKASKYRNPINDVGVTKVYGLDDPFCLTLEFVREHEMTPEDLIGQLNAVEKKVFRTLFAGGFAKMMYRLYEFSSSKIGK